MKYNIFIHVTNRITLLDHYCYTTIIVIQLLLYNILLKKLNVNVKFVVYTLTIECRIQRNK